jgi:hypothetical protein
MPPEAEAMVPTVGEQDAGEQLDIARSLDAGAWQQQVEVEGGDPISDGGW